MASKRTKEEFLLVCFKKKRRTSEIYVPAGVVIGRRVLIVLWEAVKVACVDC